MTLGRVPEEVAPRRVTAELADDLRPYGIEQQLSVPCHVEPTGYAAFVMATTGDDYHDEQLALARRVQPLLVMLHRQWQSARRVAATSGLTAREAAVLDLLVNGATSMAMGRALGISPRTAEKHVSNVYRKLGVRDRLTAALVAREAGLVPEQRSSWS
jgi:DNA-binding CsgD family transcriptional regulator